MKIIYNIVNIDNVSVQICRKFNELINYIYNLIEVYSLVITKYVYLNIKSFILPSFFIELTMFLKSI